MRCCFLRHFSSSWQMPKFKFMAIVRSRPRLEWVEKFEMKIDVSFNMSEHPNLIIVEIFRLSVLKNSLLFSANCTRQPVKCVTRSLVCDNSSYLLFSFTFFEAMLTSFECVPEEFGCVACDGWGEKESERREELISWYRLLATLYVVRQRHGTTARLCIAVRFSLWYMQSVWQSISERTFILTLN